MSAYKIEGRVELLPKMRSKGSSYVLAESQPLVSSQDLTCSPFALNVAKYFVEIG